MHLTSLVLPTLSLGVVIGIATAQTCDNGLAGVSTGDYCCTLGCGTCGGSGCSSRAEGLTGDDCCTSDIASNGILCADSGAAPCIGDVGDDVPDETGGFLGCFSDPADNRVFVQDISSASMTAEVCSEACAGSAYYGTQYSTECWCGDNADYDANGVGVCDMPCGGDADEICGGFYAMSIYENDGDGGDNDGDGGDDEDPSFLGCFSDPSDNRVFVQEISSAGMTAEICSAACAGSAYYGTQYSIECWCGDNADYDANGVGVCDMPCGGDAEEICGGSYAMSIYENSADDGEPEEFSCSGDAGVSSGSSCCEADCGTCGGSGCSSRGSGAASCCTSVIQSAGTLCSDSGAAPCIL